MRRGSDRHAVKVPGPLTLRDLVPLHDVNAVAARLLDTRTPIVPRYSITHQLESSLTTVVVKEDKRDTHQGVDCVVSNFQLPTCTDTRIQVVILELPLEFFWWDMCAVGLSHLPFPLFPQTYVLLSFVYCTPIIALAEPVEPPALQVSL